MKKYLDEIEISSIILMFIGLVLAYTVGYNVGAWPCGCGMALLLIPYLYKAFHWKEYERENKRNIWIIVLCILFIYIQLLIFRL